MDVRDESVTPEVKAILQHTLDFVPLDFGGGSSILKATAVANLIIENGYETIVEIGVYRGRFLLPQATLFRYLGRGTAYGVDPYRALSAIQLDARRFPVPARRVNQWVREQDWDGPGAHEAGDGSTTLSPTGAPAWRARAGR